MDVVEYFLVVRRHILVVLLTTGICVGIAFVGSVRMQPSYRSTVKLHVSTVTAGGSDWIELDLKYSDRLMNTYAQIAESDPVLDDLARILDLNGEHPKIEAEVLPETELMNITVTANDPDTAADAANEIAAILIERSTELTSESRDKMRQMLEERILQLQQDSEQFRAEFGTTDIILGPIGDIESQRQRISESLIALYEQRSAREAILATSLSVIDPADSPLTPYRPNIALNTVVALAVGLIGGVGLAFMLENVEQSNAARRTAGAVAISSSGAVRFPSNLDGSLNGGASTVHKNDDEPADWQEVRAKVLAGVVKGSTYTLLVTSTEPLDSQNDLIADIAKSAAEDGLRVAIADCNPLSAPIDHIFDDANTGRLSDGLKVEGSLNAVIQDAEISRVALAPMTQPLEGSVKLPDSSVIAATLQQLCEDFDLILLNAPAFFRSVTAAALAPEVDGVLLLDRSDQVSSKIPSLVAGQLDGIGANLVAIYHAIPT